MPFYILTYFLLLIDVDLVSKFYFLSNYSYFHYYSHYLSNDDLFCNFSDRKKAVL